MYIKSFGNSRAAAVRPMKSVASGATAGAYTGAMGSGVGLSFGIAAGLGSGAAILGPVYGGIALGMLFGGVPLWRCIKSHVMDQLVDLPNAKLRFFVPRDDEKTYDQFFKRVHCQLNPGDMVVDTRTSADVVRVTYMLDNKLELDCFIPRINQDKTENTTFEQVAAFEKSPQSPPAFRKLLLESKDLKKVRVWHRDKCLRRTMRFSLAGAVICGIVVCALVGFPPTSPLGFGILAACVATGAFTGAAVGIKTSYAHKHAAPAKFCNFFQRYAGRAKRVAQAEEELLIMSSF